jgi:hypothetical protein
MLSSLQAIVGSLTTLRTIRRDHSQDYIVTVIQPLQDQLQNVHADYKRSFQACFSLIDEDLPLAVIRKKIINQLKQDMALSEDIRTNLWNIVNDGAEFKVGDNFLDAIMSYLDLGAQTIEGHPAYNARRVDLMEQLTHILDLAAEWKNKAQAKELARGAIRSRLEVLLSDLQRAKTHADHLVLVEKLKLKNIRRKKPNKAQEPTSGTVTPRAEPRVAPIPPVAHL